MVPVRKQVEISEGVKVDLLFTPRLSIYQDSVAALPELAADAGWLEVMERYADIMYFAALNAWELDGHGTAEDFPHKRGDFHGWMAADPDGFAAAVKFSVSALTGKRPDELLKEEKKSRESAKETAKIEKKKRSLLYRITHPLKSFS